jgi:hypothetical protein
MSNVPDTSKSHADTHSILPIVDNTSSADDDDVIADLGEFLEEDGRDEDD